MRKSKADRLKTRNANLRTALARFDAMPDLPEGLPPEVRADLQAKMADAKASLEQLRGMIDESDAELADE